MTPFASPERVSCSPRAQLPGLLVGLGLFATTFALAGAVLAGVA